MRWFLIILLCTWGISSYGKDYITIVIDPGHGGKDPGHLSHNKKHLQEKDINLKIAKKLGYYLQHNVQNVKVIYTRINDTYPSLDKRVEFANQKGVDLFISIHCNGSPSVLTRGTETHIYDRSSKQSLRWAKAIEKEFKNRAGRHSRGIKTNRDRGNSLQVLKYTKMTSVLVECGFMTNTNEANYLNTERGQDLLASALFRATRTYLQGRFKSISFVKPKTNAPAPNKPKIANGKYKVQICSSAKNYKTNSDKFSHLKFKVHRIEVGGKIKYKYYLGPFKNKADAEAAQKNARKGGYKDAFIVKQN